MNIHVVGTKINVSWTTRATAASIDSFLRDTSMQYPVFLIDMSDTLVDTTIEMARKVSQETEKNATTYLSFL